MTAYAHYLIQLSDGYLLPTYYMTYAEAEEAFKALENEGFPVAHIISDIVEIEE